MNDRRSRDELVVLVIEDDEHAARAFKGMLQAFGFSHVRLAASVVEGLLAIHRYRPDVVMLDAGLKGMPAHRVVDELRHQDIPFLVVTGYPREMLPVAFATPPLIRKPVAAADLEKALDALLAG